MVTIANQPFTLLFTAEGVAAAQVQSAAQLLATGGWETFSVHYQRLVTELGESGTPSDLVRQLRQIINGNGNGNGNGHRSKGALTTKLAAIAKMMNEQVDPTIYRGAFETISLFDTPQNALSRAAAQISPGRKIRSKTLLGFLPPALGALLPATLKFLATHKDKIEWELDLEDNHCSFEELMQMLIDAERIHGNAEDFLAAARALDWYHQPGNPMQELPQGKFAGAQEAVHWLLENRLVWNRLAQNRPASFVTMLEALVHTGKVRRIRPHFRQPAQALDFYFLPRNPMQRLLPRQFKTPQQVSDWLIENKTALRALTRPDRISFADMTEALWQMGHTGGNLNRYRWTGEVLDIYFADGNPMQQLSAGQLKTPEEALRWLIENRTANGDWILRMKTLAQMGKLEGDTRPYTYASYALQYLEARWEKIGELVEKTARGESLTPEETLRFTQFKSKKPVIAVYRRAILKYGHWILREGLSEQLLTAAVPAAEPTHARRLSPADSSILTSFEKPKDQNAVQTAVDFLIANKRRIDAEIGKIYSYRTLMLAIAAQWKISSPLEFGQAGGALDVYFTPGNPMQSLKKGGLRSPEAALHWLQDNKAKLNAKKPRSGYYRFATLMNVLLRTGKIAGTPHRYTMAANALDFYFREGNPMQSLRDRTFRTPKGVVRWLVNNKADLNRLAKRGEAVSYATCARALYYAGKLPGNQISHKSIGDGLQYLRQKWDDIGPVVQELVGDGEISEERWSQFTLADGKASIQPEYRRIVRRYARILVQEELVGRFLATP